MRFVDVKFCAIDVDLVRPEAGGEERDAVTPHAGNHGVGKYSALRKQPVSRSSCIALASSQCDPVTSPRTAGNSVTMSRADCEPCNPRTLISWPPLTRQPTRLLLPSTSPELRSTGSLLPSTSYELASTK